MSPELILYVEKQANHELQAARDYPAHVLLHWFIREQVEEEAWSDKLLVKVREATCAGALLNPDRYITQILSSDSIET